MEGNPVSGMLGLGISSFSENNNLESNLFTNLPMKSPKSKKEQWDTILIQFQPYRAFSSTITSSTVPYFAFFLLLLLFLFFCFVLSRLGVKACIVMIPLLGISWLFGLLAPLHKAFAYIFTILNSTQVRCRWMSVEIKRRYILSDAQSREPWDGVMLNSLLCQLNGLKTV